MMRKLITNGTNRHFLARLKDKANYEVLRVLVGGSAIASIATSPVVRKILSDAPESVTVRLVAYHHAGGQPGVMVTSVLDGALYPAGRRCFLSG